MVAEATAPRRENVPWHILFYISLRNNAVRSSMLASFGLPGAHASAWADSARNGRSSSLMASKMCIRDRICMAVSSLDILNLSHSFKDVCEAHAKSPECPFSNILKKQIENSNYFCENDIDIYNDDFQTIDIETVTYTHLSFLKVSFIMRKMHDLIVNMN